MEHTPVILSILICSLESRLKYLNGLLQKIDLQIDESGENIEVICETDRGESSIGTKRNSLIAKASGEYVCFIDDDDDISDDYIKCIVGALKSKPDCVGIEGKLISLSGESIFRHSIQFQGWYTGSDAYYRTPNHLNPVKRNIAVMVGFPISNFGEDHWYSNGLRQALKTEEYIGHPIYFYNKVEQI